MINLKQKYNRIFAFGCSYTRHIYPTYADIIANQYPDARFVNLGKSGAGNQFLMSHLSQAHRVFSFAKDDLIIIMYPSVTREDRWLSTGTWHTMGNIFHSHSKNVTLNALKFYKTYGCFLHYLIRDLCFIDMMENFLNSLSCDKITLMSTPLSVGEGLSHEITSLIEDDNLYFYQKICMTYKDLFEKYPIDYQTYLRKTFLDKNILTGVSVGKDFDSHPSPLQALSYLQAITEINETGISYAHKHEQLLSQCNSIEEVKELYRVYQREIDIFLYDQGIV